MRYDNFNVIHWFICNEGGGSLNVCTSPLPPWNCVILVITLVEHIILSKQPVDGLPKCAIQFVLQDRGGSSNNMLTVCTLSFKQTENMHYYCYRYKKGQIKKKTAGTYNKTTVNFF